jgi:sodium/bile acid cotransporter 7
VKRYIDGFVVALFAVVALGIALPTSGQSAEILGWATKFAIAVLFFLYGGRLSTAEVLAGLRHWRLQLSIVAITFAAYPIVGVAAGALLGHVLPEDLVTGFVFVTLLCSTVQTCIANTAIARGNVPAAVIAASTSSVLGVFITPMLVAGVLATTGAAHVDLHSVVAIVIQILLPFAAGQLVHFRLGGVLKRNDKALKRFDRGLILFAVFAAFSKGSGAGAWTAIPLSRFVVLFALCVVLLAVLIVVADLAGRLLRFPREDRIVVTLVGTSKSLAVGLPMATVLFAGHEIALVVLPLMFFHPIQMIACTVMAQQMGRRAADVSVGDGAPSAPNSAYEELLLRLDVQLPAIGDGAMAWLTGVADEPSRTAPAAANAAPAEPPHEHRPAPRVGMVVAGRVGMVVAGRVGAMVIDADARPAIERFATSARTGADYEQLIEELRPAGVMDGGPPAHDTLAELLAAAAEYPVRVILFDTRAGLTNDAVSQRLPTATGQVADAVGQLLGQLPAGRKLVALVGSQPHNGDASAAEDFLPGDAIYYIQPHSWTHAPLGSDSTLLRQPTPQHVA